VIKNSSRKKRQEVAKPSVDAFKRKVWSYYRKAARTMPWRTEKGKVLLDYKVFVSEIMLQQTQVSRVTRKYESFLKRFPTVFALAEASKKDLLEEWQGLGYNRRALNMQKAAQVVSADYKGAFPRDLKKLDNMPGIGEATAAAILNYAFEIPVPFIETNIRRALIHHFFPKGRSVSDKRLLPLAKEALDEKNPREWHYALMDYGSFLARTVPNPNRKSSRYSKQSRFEGSRRQVRGRILRILARRGHDSSGMPIADMYQHLGVSDHDLESILSDMIEEGFIRKEGERISF